MGRQLQRLKMEERENTLGFQEQPKVEVESPPLSPRSNSDDDDETEPDYTDGEEEEGGAAVVRRPPLKKGPWTPEEDKRLRTYVEAHGEGNWNHVQRNAGLNRCGKSCRLRWANHLRPHLKKGPFSKEEENTIIELHATHGNKWAKMASMLEGRTDNEIKNFWNTRSKRRKKFGLSLYPDDLLSRMKTNQDMDSHSPDDSHGKKRQNELSQENGLEFDDIVFEKLDYKKRAENFLAPPFTFPDALPLEAVNPLKRHASCDMVSSYGELEKTCYADMYPGIIKCHSVPFTNAIANGPSILDGNFSTSGTIQPIKMELPSLQNTGYESLNSCSYHIPSATPLEHVDTFVPSPASVLLRTDYYPSQNNGLLDAMVLQGHVGAYEVLGPPVYPLSPHSSVFDDNLLEGSRLDEFRTSKSPASLDTILADGKHQADAIFGNKCLLPSLYGDSPHSEYQPINEPIDATLFGVSCDEHMLSAQGDGHQQSLESVLWNSMPGARHVPGS